MQPGVSSLSCFLGTVLCPGWLFLPGSFMAGASGTLLRTEGG